MTVDVVVVTFDSEATISECIGSVTGDPVVSSVVVVDNCSSDGSADEAESLGATVVRNTANAGFGAGCNLGARQGTADWILLLNPDASMEQGALGEMVRYGENHDGIAVVASEVLGPTGQAEPVRRRFPTWWRAFAEPGLAARLDERYYARRQKDGGPVDWASASALLVRRRAFEAIDGFDEGFFLYAEEIDLCARLRRSRFGVHWIPGCPSRHAPGSSTGALTAAGKIEWARGFRRYVDKHARHKALFGAVLAAGLGARVVYWTARGDRPAARKWWAAVKAFLAA